MVSNLSVRSPTPRLVELPIPAETETRILTFDLQNIKYKKWREVNTKKGEFNVSHQVLNSHDLRGETCCS